MVTIKAKKVRPGHSIPGLDNGYVVEAEDDGVDVEMLFHTAEGEEAKLVCPRDMPIIVDQAEPRWVG